MLVSFFKMPPKSFAIKLLSIVNSFNMYVINNNDSLGKIIK